MGISKAMMEKLMVAKSRLSRPETRSSAAPRYGNVMALARLGDPAVHSSR